MLSQTHDALDLRMTNLRILAVDDEPLALRRVELLLARIPAVELIGTATSGKEAIQRLSALKPDVLLLDIQMAGLGGFDVVDALQGPHVPKVIFATAFDRYATQAFEVSAVDYIVKPVELDRLRAALDKARHSLRAEDAEARVAELRQIVVALREQAHASESRAFEKDIWAERRGDFVPIRVTDIFWVEAERDYVKLHTADASFLLRETLSNMENRLDPEQFIRIRRSAVVRRDKIAGVRRPGYGDFRVRLTSGAELRVGRTFVKHLRAIMSGS